MLKVVIADDNLSMRGRMQEALRVVAHEIVGTATTGSDALSMIVEHKPDLAMLDNQMFGMTGREVAIKVKELGLPTKVLMVTSMAQKGLHESADGVLIKPYHQEQLYTKLYALFPGIAHS